MKIFEKEYRLGFGIDLEGNDAYEFLGVSIVFGEENNSEERFKYLVPRDLLGCGRERAFNRQQMPQEEAFERLLVLDLDEIKPMANRVALADVYPAFDPKTFTKAAPDIADTAFLKHLSLLAPRRDTLTMVKGDMYTENRACEVLKQSPCPYLATYLGCEVRGDFVTGFYYERYNELFQKPQPWNVKKYIADIRKGIEHLHSVGLCHNDVSPENIMLTDDDRAVLIDFDACRPIGELLVKVASEAFRLEDIETSEVENDWYALDKTEEYMIEHCEEELSRTQE